MRRKTIHYEEQAALGGAETRDAGLGDYHTVGSSGRLFLVQYLKAFARYPEKCVIHERSAEVDGHSCEVFSFITGKDYKKGSTEFNYTERFYLDFGRGGHAIKVEFLSGSRLQSRLVNVKLEQFPTRVGDKVWLPVTGRFEGFLAFAGRKPNDPLLYVKYPTNLETISVMKGSVRINAGLGDEHFRLRLKNGTLIKDGVTGKVIRSGKDVDEPPANLEEAQERLRRHIEQAELQGNELRASSLARGAGWLSMTWIPWMIALLMTILFCVMLIRQRTRA